MTIITEPYNDIRKLNEMESQINEYMRIIHKITLHYLYNTMPTADHNIDNPIRCLTTLLQELEKTYLKNNIDEIEKAKKHGGKVIKEMSKYFESENKKTKEGQKTWLELYEIETGEKPTIEIGDIEESIVQKLGDTLGSFLSRNLIPTHGYIKWVIKRYINEKK